MPCCWSSLARRPYHSPAAQPQAQSLRHAPRRFLDQCGPPPRTCGRGKGAAPGPLAVGHRQRMSHALTWRGGSRAARRPSPRRRRAKPTLESGRPCWRPMVRGGEAPAAQQRDLCLGCWWQPRRAAVRPGGAVAHARLALGGQPIAPFADGARAGAERRSHGSHCPATRQSAFDYAVWSAHSHGRPSGAPAWRLTVDG
jgi:hypothetical protein